MMISLQKILALSTIVLAVTALQPRPTVRAKIKQPTVNGFSRQQFAHVQSIAQQFRQPSLFMTADETPEKDAPSNFASSSAAADSVSNSGSKLDEATDKTDVDEASSSGGLTRTLLLAAPLFCKFVIVLLIKFLTDLVVFPLLFLYRIARLFKRRIMKALFSKRNKEEDPFNGRVNGAKGSAETDTNAL